MCGIVGVLAQRGPLTGNSVDVFQQLLIVSQLRGYDSTGIITAARDKDNKFRIDWLKDACNTQEFLSSSGISEKTGKNEMWSRWINTRQHLLIGHTRAATIGAIETDTAHPFDYKNVIGVHNGTIRGEFYKENGKQFKSDSQMLYAMINNMGLFNALKRLQDYNPAYALAFINKKHETLNLVRNSERPLSYVLFKDRDVWFASEKAMLEFMLTRHEKHNRVDEIVTLKEGEWVTFPINKPDAKIEREILSLPKPKPKYEYYYSNHNRNWGSSPWAKMYDFNESYDECQLPLNYKPTQAIARACSICSAYDFSSHQISEGVFLCEECYGNTNLIQQIIYDNQNQATSLGQGEINHDYRHSESVQSS